MTCKIIKRLGLIGVLIAFAVSCTNKSEQDNTSTTDAEEAAGSRFSSPIRPEQWPTRPEPPVDQALEAKIDGILSRMTLEQKVGQVIQADSGSTTPEDVRLYRLGSILSGGNSAPGGRPYGTVTEWLTAADAYYDASIDPEGVDVAIPIMWGIDAVHGHNNVLGGTIFPHNIGLGAARNPELVRDIAAATARELRVTGHDWTFAPTLTVPQDDRWGRTYEGFSEDPELVALYAPAIVTGLQGLVGTPGFLGPDKVTSTAKHFVGDGGTVDGRDQGDTRVSEIELRDTHGAVYPSAIEAGVQAIMASFSSWNGRRVHGDHGLLTGVLRDRFRFDGLVVGDWNAHGQIETCTNESCAIAINAGLDMFMAPDSWKGLYENTLRQVGSGEISMARLDEAVRRILRVKLRAGLFDAGRPSARPYAGDESLLSNPSHRALARAAVSQSLVLLKNNGPLLPLKPGQRVLVAGDGADNISKQSGGWTLSWQGSGHSNDEFPNGQSIFAGIDETVTQGGGTAVLSVDGRYTKRPDVAIVVFGEDPYAEFQGDLDHLAYDPVDGGDLELLKRLKTDGIPVVSIFLSGRPLWVNPEINASDAFVAAWLPGTEGGGISDVLFRLPNGEINLDFTGRLSFSWPKSAVQAPQNRGGENYDPLFPYGYGLTYADDGSLAVLPEDSGLPQQTVQSKYVYFSNGRTVEPWRLVVEEQGAGKQAIESARGTGRQRLIEYATDNRSQQEDTRSITWLGPDSAAVMITGGELDISREANGDMALVMDFRVDSLPAEKVMLGLSCGDICEGAIEISNILRTATVGDWHTLSVPLSCFQEAGADMSRILEPFKLHTSGPLALSFSNIRLASANPDDIDCPPPTP